MDNTSKEIVEILNNHEIASSDIDFYGSDGKVTSFRYRYWKPLPQDAYDSIKHLVYEDLYEDYDGDDGYRPIIRRMWSYQFIIV